MCTHKQTLIQQFDPNGVGLGNGDFIGLPFDLETAGIIAYPVPWDVTVSYGTGTADGPRNILAASTQLDLYLEDAPNLWKEGIHFLPPDAEPRAGILAQSQSLRNLAEQHIRFLESGKIPDGQNRTWENIDKINAACAELHRQVQRDTTELLQLGKRVVLVGGDHSTPLGYIKALAERHPEFGILQIDAHCDLRAAYEGFTYSHASIFYNVWKEVPQVNRITQVGIRDFCEEEAEMAQREDGIRIFSEQNIRDGLFEGGTFAQITDGILDSLPQKVYVSFDIDGLSPEWCPSTGTPVPGGLSFSEATYLLRRLKASGKEIIGCDLCEVGGGAEWDGNVGARILYRLMALLG